MDGITAYRKTIQKNPLFSGMTQDEMIRSAELLGANVAKYGKGDIIHRPWTVLANFGLVISGSVQACADDIGGNRMIMADVQPGTTFGESLCWLKVADSPVYIYASEEAAVMWLSPDILYSGSTDGCVLEMQKRFASLLASRTLAMNERIQILSKLTIRDRLTVYFSSLASSRGSDEFEVPLNREDMATYIGANRAALSRELSRMKREGIIDYRKNRFILKKHIEK